MGFLFNETGYIVAAYDGAFTFMADVDGRVDGSFYRLSYSGLLSDEEAGDMVGMQAEFRVSSPQPSSIIIESFLSLPFDWNGNNGFTG